VIDARALVGTADILLLTLDTLRLDVAERAMAARRTPNLARLLPGGVWQRRHSPASFTYAAHHAFFAGFLPTPEGPGPHPRPFAMAFPGSESIADGTAVFDSPDLVGGLAAAGYHTLCIGGVGFFNKQSPLGSVLPGLFAESHWNEVMGVTSPCSTERQVALACRRIADLPPERRLFLFLNISALHQPNCLFTPGATSDDAATQEAALAYVDSHLPPLFRALTARAPLLAVLTSDHGTAYGEDGYHGHRLAHPAVWRVPYGEFVVEAGRCPI